MCTMSMGMWSSVITQPIKWQYFKIDSYILPRILRLDSSIGAEHVRKME